MKGAKNTEVSTEQPLEIMEKAVVISPVSIPPLGTHLYQSGPASGYSVWLCSS